MDPPLGFTRFCTFSLRSSRSASRALQRAARAGICAICSATSMARALRAGLRLPMLRRAQLTAFLTKLRSSAAWARMAAKKGSKSLAGRCLS